MAMVTSANTAQVIMMIIKGLSGKECLGLANQKEQLMLNAII
jgi:hypothetical protein